MQQQSKSEVVNQTQYLTQKVQDRQQSMDIFSINTESFIHYQKHIDPESYRSRQQKNKERHQKLQKRLKDPVLKKQARKERKAQMRSKINEITDKMSKEDAHVYIKNLQLQKKQQKLKLKASMETGQPIFIDMVYSHLMNQKENKSLGKQLTLVLKAIKLFEHPPSMHLWNFTGRGREVFQKMKYQHLALTVHEEDVSQYIKKNQQNTGNSQIKVQYVEEEDKERKAFKQNQQQKKKSKRIIYLSPDSQTSLDQIYQTDVFILGGLIDRTIIKNASLQRSEQLGICAMKLPIRQYMKGRTCLNLDHVVTMICKFKECGDWKVAFDYAAPKRWKKDQVRVRGTAKGKDKMNEKAQDQQGSNDESNSSNEKQQKSLQSNQKQQNPFPQQSQQTSEESKLQAKNN